MNKQLIEEMLKTHRKCVVILESMFEPDMSQDFLIEIYAKNLFELLKKPLERMAEKQETFPADNATPLADIEVLRNGVTNVVTMAENFYKTKN